MSTTTAAGQDRTPLPKPAAGTVPAFWAMMTVVFLAAMDSTVVATVLPSIVTDLGGASLLAWVVTSYLLTTAVSIPLWGKSADLTNSRWLYAAATLVFLLGSAAGAFAPSMPALLVARAVQGVGTGGLMVLTPTIIGEIFPSRIRGRFQGRQGAVLAGSSIVGPLIGGFLNATLGWRAAFWINLPLAGASLVIVLYFLRALPTPEGRRRIDLVGAALLAVASTTFLIALSEGAPATGVAYRVLLLVVAGVTALAYLSWQARHDDPVLPLRMLRSPIVASATALSFATGAAMIATVVYAPLYAQTVQGRSAAYAGALLLPLTGGVLVANVVGGNLITRLGRYRPFPIAGTIAATAGFGLLATIGVDTGLLLFTSALALVGVGIGLSMQPAVLALQNAVDATDLGAATAASTFFRQLGSTLAVGVLGGLLSVLAGPQLAALTKSEAGSGTVTARAELADAFGTLFLVLAVVAAVAVVIALVLPEKSLSNTAPAESGSAPVGSDEVPATR